MLASLLLNRYVLGFIGVLAVVAGLAYGWYQLKEKYRNEGRAEVQLVFDKYKAEMQQVADKAKSENEALAAKNAALAAQLAKRISVSLASLSTKTQEVTNAIQAAPIAECAIPERLRDSINAVRASAAAEIDAAYRASRAVQ